MGDQVLAYVELEFQRNKLRNKSHFICTKVSIKKMKRLSEPGHEISNNVVYATSEGSDVQSNQSRC